MSVPTIDDGQLFTEDGSYGGLSAYDATNLNEQWFEGRSNGNTRPNASVNDQYVFAFGDESLRSEHRR